MHSLHRHRVSGVTEQEPHALITKATGVAGLLITDYAGLERTPMLSDARWTFQWQGILSSRAIEERGQLGATRSTSFYQHGAFNGSFKTSRAIACFSGCSSCSAYSGANWQHGRKDD